MVRDEKTYKIIGAAIEVQSADYADLRRLLGENDGSENI